MEVAVAALTQNSQLVAQKIPAFSRWRKFQKPLKEEFTLQSCNGILGGPEGSLALRTIFTTARGMHIMNLLFSLLLRSCDAPNGLLS